MFRRSSFITLLLLLLLAISAPAGAATVDQVVSGLGDGVYVESGVSADESRLRSAVDRADFTFAVVILDEEPSGGSEGFALSVRDEVGRGTVLVLSASGAGLASVDFSDAEVSRALDRGLSAGNDEAITDAVVDELASFASPATTVAASSSDDGGGGGAGLIVFLAIIGGLILLAWWAIRRGKKRNEDRLQQSINEARAEIKGQLDAMANVILDITDSVKVSDTREDNTYLEQASVTFTEVSEQFETATDLGQLESLSDRLDEARWQLDAAEALVAGRTIPEKPKPEERHACFFDPIHPGPFEDADIRTAAGDKTVKVCVRDAERLRRGRDPEPRMIEVEGRPVPAPSAPRSHGGGGIDLGGIFSILVGGASGGGRSLDWGASQAPPRRRSRQIVRGPSSGSSAGRSRTRKTGGSAGRKRRRG